MKGKTVLATYLVGLREGIEAAIIISILVGYVVKLGERNQLAKIAWGTAAAVALSLAVGFGLSEIAAEASEQLEITITGTTSILAVSFVTWMIFWMSKQARALSTSLRAQVDAAVARSAWSLAGVAFLAVVREGVETSILLWSTAKTTQGGTVAFGGAFLGIATAAVLGYFMYRGVLRFNLGTFFKYTALYLIVLAGGIFAYGIGEFQELGWLPFLTQHSYDVSAVLPEGSIGELILAGTIGFNSAPTVLQSLAWVLYVVPVAVLFARQSKVVKHADKVAAA